MRRSARRPRALVPLGLARPPSASRIRELHAFRAPQVELDRRDPRDPEWAAGFVACTSIRPMPDYRTTTNMLMMVRRLEQTHAGALLVNQIADELGVHRRTVVRWLKALEAE